MGDVVNEIILPIIPIVNPTGLRLRARSRTATRVPGAARSMLSAAARPAGPPPTMHTSTSVLIAAAMTTPPALRLRLLLLLLLMFLRGAAAPGNKRGVLLCTARRRVEGERRGSELLCIAVLLLFGLVKFFFPTRSRDRRCV